jgi:2-iminobutanoate/2-iminopropanoate deaminase
MKTRLRAAQTLLGVLALLLVPQGVAAAQAPTLAEEALRQEEEYINYGTWATRVNFSQEVSVRTPGRWIFLSGVGSEGDNPMHGILFPGHFLGQRRHAWKEIRSRVERQGASVNDIVRVVMFVTDLRNLAANDACRARSSAPNRIRSTRFS